MYGLTNSGQIDTQYPPGQAASVAAEIRRLRGAGKQIVPSIANITGGKWSYGPVGRMLHSPELMAAQVAAIVALVQRDQYAGIDVDYENLHAADRQAFSTFVTRLGPRPARPGQGAVGRGVRQDHRRGDGPAQRGPGLRGYRPRRRPGAADGLRLPLGQFRARAGGPDQLGPRRAALRQDADPGQQDHSWRPALRLRLGGPPRHRRQLAPGPAAVPAVPCGRALRPGESGALVQLPGRGRSRAHRVVRERGEFPGQVRRGPERQDRWRLSVDVRI